MAVAPAAFYEVGEGNFVALFQLSYRMSIFLNVTRLGEPTAYGGLKDAPRLMPYTSSLITFQE